MTIEKMNEEGNKMNSIDEASAETGEDEAPDSQQEGIVFKDAEERKFWERVYVRAVRAQNAVGVADMAVAFLRERMGEG